LIHSGRTDFTKDPALGQAPHMPGIAICPNLIMIPVRATSRTMKKKVTDITP